MIHSARSLAATTGTSGYAVAGDRWVVGRVFWHMLDSSRGTTLQRQLGGIGILCGTRILVTVRGNGIPTSGEVRSVAPMDRARRTCHRERDPWNPCSISADLPARSMRSMRGFRYLGPPSARRRSANSESIAISGRPYALSGTPSFAAPIPACGNGRRDSQSESHLQPGACQQDLVEEAGMLRIRLR